MSIRSLFALLSWTALSLAGAKVAGAADLPPVADGWGHLKVRFVYAGDPPQQTKLTVTKDIEVCTKNPPLDESLVVNSQNKGVANVVVWLYAKSEAPKVHASYDGALKTPVKMDNKWCRYEPRVALLRAGQPLELHNSDTIGHNVKADLFENVPFNVLIPAGGKIVKNDLTLAERLPMPVGCTIHPWMSAKLLIQDHPYMAISDANGEATIAFLPTGQHTFQFWHEASGNVSSVLVAGAPTEWKKGRVDLTIDSKVNDLGVVTLPVELFKK